MTSIALDTALSLKPFILTDTALTMSNTFDYTFFDDPNWFNNINNDLLPCSNASGFLSSCSYPPVPTSILRSNCAPSQTDVTQTNAILQEEQQELQRYDEEIRRSRLVLESLEAERDLLDRKMQERRSWLAPIRRLSKEVLGKIFAVTVGLSESDFSLAIGYDYGDDESDDEYSSSVQAPALALSQVSSHWRNVACEQRSIWSSIHLELHKMEADFTGCID
ncbi:hypothetical protein VNI00_015708 [Paramarasmius palmivorus]|uniref:F-box domain-containing protein n=1 Tax=Paramarasmius palmivorus TaxID=297713 RepID=A0AAW0BIB1_9AGAR